MEDEEDKPVKLSERLEMAVSLVTPGHTAADIGTDHGFVPVRLVESGRSPRALAMDIGEGPLSRAEEHIRARGLQDRIETRLSDGLKAYRRGECDTIILTGMGGELMVRILEEGWEKMTEQTELVLSPHTHIEKLREFLDRKGCRICREACVPEDGKYYFFCKAVRGDGPGLIRDYLLGDLLQASEDPAFAGWLEKEMQKYREILERIDPDSVRGKELKQLLARLEERRSGT